MASKLAPNSFIVVFFFLCSLINVPSTKAQLETLAPDQAKAEAAGMTHIHFFFHDILSGKNPTAVTIIQPASGSTTSFGLMNMMDDKLTEGPDPSSKEVGRAQGLYAASCLGEIGFMQAMNLVFTDGAYNGSVITVLGRNAPMHATREMSIVGGTGQFRFARGYAIAKTQTLDYTTGDATVEYNVYVTTH
ncbi:Dirigent protein [Rhynchospora pubera]|uniref:Dirigent protein n=1 Tax=Rhynchospora pubera TaxID=906938 RepID=A0AAV8FUT8_9POAL|nr:Dirigent protein [Rhynchospora pubera]KAJ4766310.1 Dirigent protein [Rhynchospora pubera]KAJ4795201.1 Dirigent protein [Rhynchospora pubera]KAJ4819033.1 Dirigent protein [Rhynchospora pubera]